MWPWCPVERAEPDQVVRGATGRAGTCRCARSPFDASRVIIRQAPMAVQNTIQPTMTSDAAKVDSGISSSGPAPAAATGTAAAERRRQPARLDMDHGHAHDRPARG